ncbi:hypothetical protein ROG8370_01122 [Roseovarius gaetbuli]|uniref:Uncharacterized protein n=1 Tax=Roseovarius gaetbuli TaxID=1356575 RepID=A0A1X6YR54_9RHOB|nr:hypothetical protein [Roseovarius gaetbuli]SLN28834.1 hypothetical protein ROG8370_01122 [Roseovarius gaetbuli]
MEIILHLGAHRTASTSFQHYMNANRKVLEAQGIGYWGPDVTRDGVLTGVIPVAGRRTATEQLDRARGRIALRLHRAEAAGLRQLVVSDENMIGTPRRNLRDNRLYGGIGDRMARFANAFDGRITRVAVSVRGQDAWWSSAMAFAVGRGHRVPGPDDLDRLVTVNRHWRDVITDLACAVPGAETLVLPHEVYADLPEEKLRQMTGIDSLPRKAAREWLNRAPDLEELRKLVTARGGDCARLGEGTGRWRPFDRYQTLALQEAYSDDLFWLSAGAGRLARLTEETGPVKAGQNPPIGQTTRGHPNDEEERRLA